MRYIIETQGRLYCFFYRDNEIWFCEFKEGEWLEEEVLARKVHGGFSANLVEDEILMFYQDSKKGLVESRFKDGAIITETLVVNNETLGRYYAVPSKDGMNLVYNLPVLGDGGYALVSQFLGLNRSWGALRRVDTIHPMAEEPFKLVPVADKHFLVFYQSGGLESKLGYREIYDGEVGRYNLLHSGSSSFGDSSFLATRHELHALYMVRGMFGSRLMYRKKGADGFSPGIVVAEGQNIHNVLLYIAKDAPHLSFMRGNDLFRMGLGEKGGSQNLLPLGKEENIHEGPIAKASFLSDNVDPAYLLANELLVNREKPWDIKFLQEYVLGRHKQGLLAQSEAKNLYTTTLSEEDYNSFFNDIENEFLDDDF
ncbi:MAG: hypothetical protein FWC76_04715 [Defluviitaleaceae bacterium]|nr:hypothetical protein [Defluviitaleaceae bacterium]